MAVDRVDLGADRAQCFAGLVNQRHAARHILRGTVDQGLDFFRCSGRTLGQFAHFLGNHRKTSAAFAGACRLDAGIERQKVGLERNFVDDADDLGDLARGGLDIAHRLDRLLDDLAGAHGFVGGSNDGFARFLGAQRRLPGDRGDLLECGGRLLERRGLLFGPLGHLVGGGGQFPGVGRRA